MKMLGFQPRFAGLDTTKSPVCIAFDGLLTEMCSMLSRAMVTTRICRQ
jgi:hypothetical protein